MSSLSSEHLKALVENIENVVNDTKNASPATQGRVRSALRRVSSSLNTSVTGGDNGAGNKKSSENHKAERQAKIEERVASLRAEIGEEVISPVTTAGTVLSMNVPKTKVLVEDQALCRTVRGYGSVPTAEWIRLLTRHQATSATFQARCDASTLIDEQDEDERVRMRFEHLIAATSSGPGSVFIDRLLRIIEDLKFMIVWATNSNAEGGKSWVSKKYTIAFQGSEEHRERFQSMNDRQKKAEMAEPEVAGLFSQWKRKNETIVSKRWQLWHGYQRLGAGILLEAMWDIENRVSPTLGPVLTQFYDSLSDANTLKLHSRQVATENTIGEVCRVLGGEGVHDFVYAFLQDFPSDLSIER
ncbi:hypothetical protein PLICRDRAFT_38910 [Plicaturopsis crispa FD-325 SS-3]|nr:hypothetical protein PLICRDRAFT_38910 [Plicaturopsis crispa FD-325 SS-3]